MTVQDSEPILTVLCRLAIAISALLLPSLAQTRQPELVPRIALQEEIILQRSSIFQGLPSTSVAPEPRTSATASSSLSNSESFLVRSSKASVSESWCCTVFHSAPVELSSVAFNEENHHGPSCSKKVLPTFVRPIESSDRNRAFYYKNKLEFSLESGWLPINIPFPFDFLLGDGYTVTGLKYTLVPIFASVRWQLGDARGPLILRGNWDVTLTGSITAIPRGPETRYFSYIMGIRRNFVPRRWWITPYVDGSVGMGRIDAKGPLGVLYSQGQDFTFTLNLGSGVRYNLSPKYGIQAGIHYMHISNLYLSEPKFLNYGINVYGPMLGLNVRLGKPRQGSE